MIQEKKQECDEDFLPTELRQVAVGFRLEMVELAYMCYKSASQCVDEESEEWLTDYMMGKCLEKMHKAPKEYLNFYKQVSCYDLLFCRGLFCRFFSVLNNFVYWYIEHWYLGGSWKSLPQFLYVFQPFLLKSF